MKKEIMFNNEPTKILLVEDNPEDAQLLREILVQSGDNQFQLIHLKHLEEALDYLSGESIGIILLDLSLPNDSWLEAMVRIHHAAPDVPVIVMAETENSAMAISAVRAGAQDYLIKGQIVASLLVRVLRYATEHYKLLADLEQTQQREQQEREIQTLELFSSFLPTSVTAQTFGLGPLRNSLPEIFDDLVQRYSNLLDLALEQRLYKVEYAVSEALRALSERLGFLKSGPRDVVEIHSTALKKTLKGVTPQKAQAYTEEGRWMVLELMGYLVSYYRNYFILSVPKKLTLPNSTKPLKEKEHE
ncbi:MAG: response regulator [Chloroflexi bacterium]|nr:response regulator [Chloroflexota bacterium]